MPEIQTLGDMAADSAARYKQPGRPGEPVSAERAIAADAERRERERLSKRKEVRQQIAERAELMQAAEDLAAQLRLLDARADGLAAEHQSKTAPIQESLTSASGSKRSALLEKLTAANIELEQGLAVVERMRGPLTKQHRETRSSAAALPTEQRLAGADLASPKLLAEKFALEQRLAAAQQRTERARDWVGTYDSQLQMASSTPTKPMSFGWIAEHAKVGLNYDRINLLEFRLSKWQCELTHASSEQFAAQQALDEITREMIAE